MVHTPPLTVTIDKVARAQIELYARALEEMVSAALERGCGVLVEWSYDSEWWQMAVDPSLPAETIVEKRLEPGARMRRVNRQN